MVIYEIICVYFLVINYPYAILTQFFFLYCKEELHFRNLSKISQSPLPGVYSREMKTYVHTKAGVHSTIFHNSPKVEIMQMSNWKMNPYNVEEQYKEYSFIKGGKYWHATTGMNLKNIMPSDRASHQRPRIVWFHLDEKPSLGKSIETENRFMVAFLWGYRGLGVIAKYC